MIGLVLISHGRLAQAFIEILEHVVGPQKQIAAIGILAEDDMEQRRVELAKAIDTVDTGSGAIVLTDMFGGTPSNIAITMMSREQTEVIAGVNLPMLIRLATIRETLSLEDAVLSAQEAARKYISVASSILNDA